MKIKLTKKESQFIINSLWICSLISILSIFILKQFIPNKTTQDIATTVSGILGTTFSFFGSILVFLALKAQIKANKQVQKQFEKQEEEQILESRKEYFRSRSNLILNEINSFYYSVKDELNPLKNRKLNYQGSQAILKLLENSKNTFYGQKKVLSADLIEPKLKELESLLIFFEITILEIKNDIILDDNIKSELAKFLKFVFESKLRNNFKSVEDFKSRHNESCPDNCGNFHGIPLYLFDLIDRIKVKVDFMALY